MRETMQAMSAWWFQDTLILCLDVHETFPYSNFLFLTWATLYRWPWLQQKFYHLTFFSWVFASLLSFSVWVFSTLEMNQSICIWSHLYNCGLTYESNNPPTVTLPRIKIEFHKPPGYLKVIRLVERQIVLPLTKWGQNAPSRTFNIYSQRDWFIYVAAWAIIQFVLMASQSLCMPPSK